MPYTPNAYDLMDDAEFERLSRRTLDEMQAVWATLYGHEGEAPKVVDKKERDALKQRYDELHHLSHLQNAARGRRTYKRDHGDWPDLGA